MYVTDDIQDALDLWNADETQWILTDGVEYAVGQEMDAFHAMMTTHWRLTSPEELAAADEAAEAAYVPTMYCPSRRLA